NSIVVATGAVLERTSTDGCVKAAAHPAVSRKERTSTDGRVKLTGSVTKKRICSNRRVEIAADMVRKCERAVGCVLVGAVVMHERGSSNGRVFSAGGVKQKRCCTQCGIRVRIVEDERSSANTGIEVAATIRKERTPPQPCVCCAGSEYAKRV